MGLTIDTIYLNFFKVFQGATINLGSVSFFDGSWFTFMTDGSKDSKEFVNKLKSILKEYRGASFKPPDSNYSVYAVILSESTGAIAKERAYSRMKTVQKLIERMMNAICNSGSKT